MAKLILVLDVVNTAQALAADMANNGNARFTVRSNSGRRAKAFLGEYAEAPHSNVLEGPKTMQIEEAYVAEGSFLVQGAVVPVKRIL